MGSECTKSCSKIQTKSHKTTIPSHEIDSRFSSSSYRDTINDYSISNVKYVQHFANTNNLQALKTSLDNGFLVDYPLDQSGWSLLHFACQKNNLNLLKLLLDYKPYIDAQETAEGWTPLMICAINNFPLLANLLIDKGADLKILDKSEKNARQLAEKYRSEEVLEIL